MSDAGTWTPIVGSVRGSAHERDGRPNQDAVATRSLDGEAMVVAVADGHGGARYVRSDVGSALAVQAACEEAATWWARHGARTPDAGGERSLARDWFPAVVQRWRQEVRDHVAAHPFTPDERTRAGVDALEADPFVSYGATLLAVLAGPRGVWLAQLGDGDTAVALADGSVVLPVPGDDRLVGGQTTSLALASAPDDLRVASVAAARGPRLVLLASDGYGNSFADEAWHEPTVRDFVGQLAAHGPDGVAARLPGWLAASASAGGDDTTVALLCATPAPPGRPVPPPPGPARAAVAGGPAGRRRMGPLLALAVVAALALGAAGGWLARGDGDDGAAGPAATTDDERVPEDPTSTSTELPTTTAPSSGDGERIVLTDGADGAVALAFTPDPDDPEPQRLELDRSRPVAPVQLALRVEDRTYRVVDDELEVEVDDEVEPVDLDGRGVRALAWAGGSVWVVSRDGSALAALTAGPPVEVVGWHQIAQETGSGSGTAAAPGTTTPTSAATTTTAPGRPRATVPPTSQPAGSETGDPPPSTTPPSTTPTTEAPTTTRPPTATTTVPGAPSPSQVPPTPPGPGTTTTSTPARVGI